MDTGSRDETPAIAAGFGARVLHHPWNDDFAEARNFSLDQARVLRPDDPALVGQPD
ncbi:MAG: glycosyltransferase [Candidatus Sericytochromatia bacterium]